MLFSYTECIEKYKSDYFIKKAIGNGELFKIEPGIYSDKESVSELAVIAKQYPNAVFAMNSAFYYWKLTDTIPDYYYLMTNKNSSRISDNRVKQLFDNNNSLNLGITILNVEGVDIKVFSKERMIVELMRIKNRLAFDYYKEVVSNFRKQIYELDFSLIEKYAEALPKSNIVIRSIQEEVL